MAPQKPPSAGPDEAPRGDPWHAFGYLVAGVLVYGTIGWALDAWLGTSWLVLLGILGGAGLGIYSTWARFNRPAPHERLDDAAPRQGTKQGTSEGHETDSTTQETR